MAFTPVKGKLAKLEIGATVLPAINWSGPVDGKLEDLSNFRDGRFRGATLDDATVTFTVVEDEDTGKSVIIDTAVKPGATATLKAYTNAAQTKFITYPVVIGIVGPKVEGMERHVMVDVTAQLSGAVTWPT